MFIVDGGTGLNSALDEKYAVHDKKGRRGLRLRCHNHKFRNLEDILGKDTKAAADMSVHFWNMRNSRGRKEAEAHALKLEKVLRKANLSAYASFMEAKHLHGQGIGRVIVAHLEKIASKSGFRDVSLGSSLNAEKFYCSLGYKKINKLHDPLGGIVVEMCKPIRMR